MHKVLWGEYSSAELTDLVRRNPIVIVPVGSTEQHGPHLPVAVDSLLVGEIARRAAKQGWGEHPVLAMPTVWTGLAEHHMGFGGTITLNFSVFYSLIRQICTSLDRQGVKRVVLLNGHGGNIAALRSIAEGLAAELSGVVAVATYFQIAEKAFASILEQQSHVQHACEAETSMILAIRPDLVDMDALETGDEAKEDLGSDDIYRWRPIEYWSASGIIGSPRAATAAKGERLLQVAADAVARKICGSALWLPPDANGRNQYEAQP